MTLLGASWRVPILLFLAGCSAPKAAGEVPSSTTDGAGGTNAAGASAGSTDAGQPGAGGAGAELPCDFVVALSLSERIGTVGIVAWTSTLPSLTRARIEFGLTTDYGLTAPVDLAAPQYRTLLLGLKPSRQYHLRVVAESAAQSCRSRDFVLTSGPVANGLPHVTLTDHGGEHAGGFLLSSFLASGPAFVLDADGEYVWSYGAGEIARAALSHDGKYLWYTGVDVAGSNPAMKRVTLDGLEETDFTADFGAIHHDFTLLPDDTIAFLAHDGDTDDVMERAPDGSMREVVALGDVLAATHTHANSLHYVAEDDTYTVSESYSSSFVKVTRAGHVVWILGGAASDFSGDGASWKTEHGHQTLPGNHLLFFNNGPADGSSLALEVELELTAKTATRVWSYDAGLSCPIFGDVARLPNQNTLVAFSTLGVVHEVAPDGTLVRELAWTLGGALGYLTPLVSLYPPF